MPSDDFEALWKARNAQLERALRLNEEVLRELLLGRMRSVLSRHTALVVLGLVVDAALVLGLTRFVLGHLDAPRLLACGGLLLLCVLASIASGAQRIVLLRRLDHGGAVAAMQREMGRLRMAEYRVTKWTILVSCLIWVPGLAVGAKALAGIDVFMFVPPLWVAGNVALGVVILVIGQHLSRRHVETDQMRPWARRLVEHVSGRRLAAAAGFIAQVRAFEQGEPGE